MKKWIFRICFVAITLVIALAGIISYVTIDGLSTVAQVTKYVNVDGKDVKVEIYARNSGDRYAHPVFAVCELVNKAINYKLLHPEEDVTIDYAIYRFETDTAAYYNPKSKKYGMMTSLSQLYTKDCERVAYSFIKAAKYGIPVRLIYHRDSDITARTTYDWFMKYMNEKCFFDKTKKVSDFLQVRKAEWDLNYLGSEQMHNKQLLISDYLDWDGTEYHNAVNSMTSNIDSYMANTGMPIGSKDWTHTGYTISNHDKIYEANKRYFELTFQNYKVRPEFVNAVMDAHARNELNYEDEYFMCYFTPVPQQYTDAYDVDANPYARYVEQLNESKGQIKCYLNNYHFSSNQFSNRFATRLNDAFKNNTTEGNEFGCAINRSLVASNKEYQLLKEIGKLYLDKMTHGKDAMFYFGDTKEYITITGSINLELGEFCAKSNTGIVFKETEDSHEIYDCFYKIYLNTCAQ